MLFGQSDVRLRIESAAGVEYGRFAFNVIYDPHGSVLGHVLQKAGKVLKKGSVVALRVEKHPVCCKGSGDVGEAVLQVHALTRCQWVGELVLVEIDERRRAGRPPEGLQIREAEHITGDKCVIAFRILDLVGEVEGCSPEPPLPKACGQGVKVYTVDRVLDQPLGEISV